GGAYAFGAVGRLEHLVPFVLEQDLQHLPRVVVVFHDEHAAADGRARRRLTIDVRRDFDARQANGEDAAESGAGAFGLHRSPVQLDECPDEREADPEAALRAVHGPLTLDEQAEDQWQDFFGDAGAVVFQAQHGVRALRVRLDTDSTPGRRVFHRVAEEVQDDLV